MFMRSVSSLSDDAAPAGGAAGTGAPLGAAEGCVEAPPLGSSDEAPASVAHGAADGEAHASAADGAADGKAPRFGAEGPSSEA